MINDTNNLVRKLGLHFYFANRNINTITVRNTSSLQHVTSSLTHLNDFKLPSSWTAPISKLTGPQRKLIASIRQLPYRMKGAYNKSNIDTQQRKELLLLSKNDNVIITPADKGGATVLMHTKAYLTEANRQLNDASFYQPIQTPLTAYNYDCVDVILRRMLSMGQINIKQYNFLLRPPHTVKQRRFYILPKIHKPIEKWLDNNTPPGRPIVSDVGSETYHTASLISEVLSPFPSTLPSYIKNTSHFVTMISGLAYNPTHLLVTADIESLYTNMDNNRCIEVVNQFLATKYDNSLTNNIIDLLKINLFGNDFVFNNQLYLQTSGVAMGKAFAPHLANIYLHDFDRMATSGFRIHPIRYLRYIDDIFFIWPGSVLDLMEFEQYVNGLIKGIKLSFTFDHNNVNFLDTTIYYWHLEECLRTKVYFKPTDGHNLLAADSFHPKHTFGGILKSQFIRYKTICYRRSDYNEACATLITALSKIGYNVLKMRKTANYLWRNNLITNNVTKHTNTIYCSLFYNQANVALSRSITSLVDSSGLNIRISTAWKANKNIGAICRRRL